MQSILQKPIAKGIPASYIPCRYSATDIPILTLNVSSIYISKLSQKFFKYSFVCLFSLPESNHKVRVWLYRLVSPGVSSCGTRFGASPTADWYSPVHMFGKPNFRVWLCG